MTKKTLFLSLMPLLWLGMLSCNDEADFLSSGEEYRDSSKTFVELPKISLEQAEIYASLFSTYLDENDTPEKERDVSTRSSSAKDIENVDFFIEKGDTLLYALNYKDGGFILIGSANTSFPILAHSTKGRINLNDINSNESGLTLFIETVKNDIKESLNNPKILDSEYYENWKDLGKEGYEYEITLSSEEPLAETRSRRKTSSGKKSIYPYTGIALDAWDQVGGYNICAPNRACIGCPAISISMLLYDCSERLTGNNTWTYPSFGYYDRRDLSNVRTETETARKLREVADYVPNYSWGRGIDQPSGATPSSVLTGVRSIGFTKAQMVSYNFETLYDNLSFKGYNYFMQETTYYRGILIGAFANYPYIGGHIWFCDGYYEQSYTVRKKFLGITVKTWTEYDDRLYMNWGAGSTGGNGWYCATDNIWTSLEHPDVHFKSDCKIFTNLNYYEYPNHH